MTNQTDTWGRSVTITDVALPLGIITPETIEVAEDGTVTVLTAAVMGPVGEPQTLYEVSGRGGVFSIAFPSTILCDDVMATINAHLPDDYVPPPAPIIIPINCTNYQARAVLMRTPSKTAGRTMFQDMDDAINAEGGLAYQMWEYAPRFTRIGALVQSMATDLSMTSDQLDAFFLQAVQVTD